MGTPRPLDPAERAARPSGRATRRLVADIAARDGDRCALCGGTVALELPGTDPAGPTLEHRIPIAAGGTNALDNLAIAHRSCNSRRGARDPDQLGRRSRTW